jgi:hypothetical protein
MSADAKWVIGIGLLIILPLIGVIWAFLRQEIKDARAYLLQLEGRFEQRTKDKDQFDYEFRHNEYSPAITRINSDLLPLMKQVEEIDKRVEELKKWKHGVVDTYLPRAVEEHERRLNRLETKIFNGHKT